MYASWLGAGLLAAASIAGCGNTTSGATQTGSGTPARTRTVARAAGQGGATASSSTAPAQSRAGLTVYTVTGESMQPTLHTGERFWVNPDKRTPQVGQIVVFHPPAGADHPEPVCGNPSEGADHPAACDQPTAKQSSEVFVKRVVAEPGDRISIVDGVVVRDGRRETGYSVAPCDGENNCTFRQTITIPAGDYYVLGDNRGHSDDSRFWGPISQASIIGTMAGS